MAFHPSTGTKIKISRLQNTFEAFSFKDFIMLPSFDAPYIVVQVLVCKDL